MIATALLGALVLATTAVAATSFVVKPGSTQEAEPCTTGAPCNYVWAIQHSTSGGVVQFESGEYALSGSEHLSGLTVPEGVTLEQAPGDTTRPLIKQTVAFPTCNCSTLSLDAGDVVKDLAIDQAAATEGHDGGGVETNDHVTIERSIISGALNGMYFANVPGAPTGGLRDTVVLAGAGAAIFDVASGITIDLDNVTAIAHGTEAGQGIALDLTNASSEANAVNATNTILRGDRVDVQATASAGDTATVTLHYSDARTAMEHTEGAKATIADTDHPTHGEPLFVSATDFEELPGSPTIDAGTLDAASGALDIERSPRVFGAATDIGAYEYQHSAPVVSTGAASAIGQSTATLAGTVDPEGLATSWYFAYGPTSALGSKTAAQTLGGPGVLTEQKISASLSGLAAGTTYHYELVASNVAGASSGSAGTFTTAAATATPAPSDSALRLSSTRFRAASRGSSVTAARTLVGTTVSYSDSQTATTTFTVLRRAPGVRSGHACIAPPRRRKRGRHYVSCARYVAVGSFTHADSAGVERFRFSGRVDGRKLSPGAYRLTATPRNAAGKSGAALSASFTIVR